MKFGHITRALSFLAMVMSTAAQAGTLTLTEISQVKDKSLENFLKISLEAKNLAYDEFKTELVFTVNAYKVSGSSSKNPVEPVKAALAKVGYENLEPVELSDIDDQIGETVEAAYLATLSGVPQVANAKMEKLVDDGQREFDEGDKRIHVYSANGVDSNHYDINSMIVYDVWSKEVLIVASQKSE